jgi:ubiquinone/menaquinone biosynthesis C-methylase UbiE
MDNTKTTKAYKGMAMEGLIASWYAKTTRNDLARHQHIAAQLVKNIAPGSRVLEIAPGPGYFCIELAKLGHFQITGLDISKSFVEIAARNAAAAGFDIAFKLGDAANQPFPNENFDFIFCQAAFKNFSRPVRAIAEIYRVLRPGGKAVIIDLRRDASRKAIDEYIQTMGLSRLNAWMTRWTFQQMLLKSAYSLAEMRAMVAQTPFTTCRIKTDLIGFQVWLEK